MADDGRSFFDFTATRPVAITMVTLAVCVFGLIGLRHLPVNLLPDIAYPTITVRTEYPGSSPRDVEERVSERIQELVAVVPGVHRIYSVSRPGVSDVVLEFAWGTQMTFAAGDVRERLDRFLKPPGAENPLVLRYDPSLDPVLTLGLTVTDARNDLASLRRFAELDLKPKLATVDGAAAVKVRGGDIEEIRVELDEQSLSALGLDVATITRRLAEENLNAASGAVEEGKTEFLVRARNEYRNLHDIEDTILVRRNDTTIKLGEVARVVRVPADPEVICRLGGKPCVLVDVQKAADGNVVEMCRAVREKVFGTPRQQRGVQLGEHERPLTADEEQDSIKRQAALRDRRALTEFLAYDLQKQGMAVALLADQSKFVQSAIDEVLDNAIQGGLLATLVLFLFLRSFFTTLVLAISIPASLVATFAPMFVDGIDLNIMSLGGLALGVGMLLDNSIVVLESISKLRETGVPVRTAAVRGTSRVAGAVFASTLTQIAVFFPIVFVEGIAGQLFRDQALTVVYAQVVSIPVALFVVPMMVSVWHGGPVTPPPDAAEAVARPGWLLRQIQAVAGGALWLLFACVRLCGKALSLVLQPMAAVFQRGYAVVDRCYPRLLRMALRRPLTVIGIALLLLLGALWRSGGLGQELLPELHQGELILEAFQPRSATVKSTDEVLARVEAAIDRLPDVRGTFLASGVATEELSDSEQGKHSARIQIELVPDNNRQRQGERVRGQVSEIVASEPSLQNPRFLTASVLQFDASMKVEVIGHDLVALRRACEQVAAALAKIPALRNVRASLQRGNPELTIRLDRDRLSALGLDPDTTAKLLRTKVQGDVPTLFAERERKLDLRLRLDREELGSEAELRQLNVNPAGYPEIPLAAVAELRRSEGPSEIRRFGNVRGAEVAAEVHGFDIGHTQLQVEAAIEGLDLPRGIIARMGPQKEELERSNKSLAMALWLAMFLVYIVMAAQFESIVQPLIIMVSVPLAAIGVVFALEVSGTDVSVMVLLGGIVLAGIVVNNAIILLDQINQLRSEGMPLQQAVLEGAHGRLRPVLMTMLTSLLGLLPQTGWLAGLPLLGGSSDGVELRSPLALTVIAGLLSSTLLTLVLVPVVYATVTRRRR